MLSTANKHTSKSVSVRNVECSIRRCDGVETTCPSVLVFPGLTSAVDIHVSKEINNVATRAEQLDGIVAVLRDGVVAVHEATAGQRNTQFSR